MEFHDQVIAVCGAGNAFGRGVADALLRRGARTVLTIGDPAAACADHAAHRTRCSAGGELIRLPDEALDRPRDIAARLGELCHLDAVINLVALSSKPTGEGGETCGDLIAHRTQRVVDAFGVLLRSKQRHGALVNVGWWAPGPDGALGAATAAAAGSLDVVTKALAKQLAPGIRVNAVLSLAVPAAGLKWPGEPEAEDVAKQLEEAAGPALFLASTAARHMTGTVLLADAGRSLGFAAFSRPDEG